MELVGLSDSKHHLLLLSDSELYVLAHLLGCGPKCTLFTKEALKEIASSFIAEYNKKTEKAFIVNNWIENGRNP